MMRVECGRSTDVGLIRSANEDSLVAEFPVFLVADGMGGYQAGEVASALVAEEFAAGAGLDSLDEAWVLTRIAAANRAVQRTGGGTTVAGVIAVVDEGAPSWLVFNVGDSRVYHRAGGVLRQVSVDHSLVQELVDTGMITPELARVHPERNVVTRAIGTDDDPQADVWLIPAQPGDRFLICSDGLTGDVDPDTIDEVMTTDLGAQQVADDLVRRALDGGGHDNITVLVLDLLELADDSVDADARSDTLDTRPLARPRPTL